MSNDKTKPKKRTFKGILREMEKIYALQLQKFTVEFLEHTPPEQLEEMIPENVGDCDAWIEEHVAKFTENEEPSVEEMVKGSAAIFMMAFMEQVFSHVGIGDAEDDDDDDDNEEDDGDNEEGDGEEGDP